MPKYRDLVIFVVTDRQQTIDGQNWSLCPLLVSQTCLCSISDAPTNQWVPSHIGSLLSITFLCSSCTITVSLIHIIDSVRTMIKYANDPTDSHSITLDAKLDRLFKECRGQRNFYITGFALFLIVWVQIVFLVCILVLLFQWCALFWPSQLLNLVCLSIIIFTLQCSIWVVRIHFFM